MQPKPNLLTQVAVTLPVAAAALLSGIGTAQAADIGLAQPAGSCPANDFSLCNKWSGAITTTIKPRDTVMNPAEDQLNYVFDFDFGTLGDTAFSGDQNQTYANGGYGFYGNNSGTGAFVEFTSTPGSPKEFQFYDMTLRNLPPFTFPAGSVFDRLDPQTGPNPSFYLPIGLGPDQYFIADYLDVRINSVGSGSNLQFETSGNYVSGDPGVPNQRGNIIFTLPSTLSQTDLFASLLTVDACNQLGAPYAGNSRCGQGIDAQDFSVTGTLSAAVPEPGATFGLATVAGLGLLLKRKGSKNS